MTTEGQKDTDGDDRLPQMPAPTRTKVEGQGRGKDHRGARDMSRLEPMACLIII